MATDLANNLIIEGDSFCAYIEKARNRLKGMSLEEALADFRAYQCELTEVREKVQVAIEQCERGESRPLDDKLFWERVDKRLDEKGIPE